MPLLRVGWPDYSLVAVVHRGSTYQSTGSRGSPVLNCTSWLVSAIKKGCDPKLAFERRAAEVIDLRGGAKEALAGT